MEITRFPEEASICSLPFNIHGYDNHVRCLDATTTRADPASNPNTAPISASDHDRAWCGRLVYSLDLFYFILIAGGGLKSVTRYLFALQIWGF